MKDKLTSILALVVVILLIGGTFFITKHYYESKETETVKVDTVTVTTTKIDTLVKIKPIYICRRVVDSIIVPVHDTTFIKLPREERDYRDSTYELTVSGYDPTLEKIKVYQKTVTNTVTVEKVVKEKQKLIGLDVYGQLGIYPTNPVYCIPSVGIDLNFNVKQWQFSIYGEASYPTPEIGKFSPGLGFRTKYNIF